MTINNNKLEEKFNLLTKLHSEMNQYRSLSKKQVEQLEANVRIEHVWSSNAIAGYETASILNTGMTV